MLDGLLTLLCPGTHWRLSWTPRSANVWAPLNIILTMALSLLTRSKSTHNRESVKMATDFNSGVRLHHFRRQKTGLTTAVYSRELLSYSGPEDLKPTAFQSNQSSPFELGWRTAMPPSYFFPGARQSTIGRNCPQTETRPVTLAGTRRRRP
jgi:hypothetical protein